MYKTFLVLTLELTMSDQESGWKAVSINPPSTSTTGTPPWDLNVVHLNIASGRLSYERRPYPCAIYFNEL